MSLWLRVCRELAMILAPLLCFLFALASCKEKPSGTPAAEDQNTFAHQAPSRDLSIALSGPRHIQGPHP